MGSTGGRGRPSSERDWGTSHLTPPGPSEKGEGGRRADEKGEGGDQRRGAKQPEQTENSTERRRAPESFACNSGLRGGKDQEGRGDIDRREQRKDLSKTI